MKMIIITTTSSHKLSAACTMSNRQLTYIFYIYVIKAPTSKKINADHTNNWSEPGIDPKISNTAVAYVTERAIKIGVIVLFQPMYRNE